MSRSITRFGQDRRFPGGATSRLLPGPPSPASLGSAPLAHRRCATRQAHVRVRREGAMPARGYKTQRRKASLPHGGRGDPAGWVRVYRGNHPFDVVQAALYRRRASGDRSIGTPVAISRTDRGRSDASRRFGPARRHGNAPTRLQRERSYMAHGFPCSASRPRPMCGAANGHRSVALWHSSGLRAFLR